MRAILLGSILLGVLSVDTTPVNGQSPDAVKLEEMEQRIVRLLLTGQRDAYAALLAPEWRVTHIDARVLTKEQVLRQAFPPDGSPFAELAVDDVQVKLFGDAAVVTGRTTARGREGPRLMLRFTDFAVKQNGRWVIVASHATEIRRQR